MHLVRGLAVQREAVQDGCALGPDYGYEVSTVLLFDDMTSIELHLQGLGRRTRQKAQLHMHEKWFCLPRSSLMQCSIEREMTVSGGRYHGDD